MNQPIENNVSGSTDGSSAAVEQALREAVAVKFSGEVLVLSDDTDEATGKNAKIYFKEGAILWAFASGQTESFQTILSREVGFDTERIISGIRKSREAGRRSLHDILLTLGIADENQRQNIIFRHTKSALHTTLGWQNVKTKFFEKPLSNPLAFKAFTAQELSLFAAPAKNITDDLRSQLSDLPSVMQRICQELQYLVAVLLVEGESGMPISALKEVDEFDEDTASALIRDLVKVAGQPLKSIPHPHSSEDNFGNLEELFISSKEHLLCVQPITPTPHYVCVVLDHRANPALAKVVLKKYRGLLAEYL
jgi:hypothetical protein